MVLAKEPPASSTCWTLDLLQIDYRRDSTLAALDPGLGGFFDERFVSAFNQYKRHVGLIAYPRSSERDARIAIGPAEFKGFQDIVLAAWLEPEFDHEFHRGLAVDAAGP